MPVPIRQLLTAEIDTHIEVGKYLLRLYCTENIPGATKELMTLQMVYNESADIRQLPADAALPAYCGWSKSDAMLLRQLFPLFRGWSVAALRRTAIELTENQFTALRNYFAGEMGRFINRDDQRPLPPPGQTLPIRQHFTLTLIDSKAGVYQISALMEFPDGTKRPFFELLRSFGTGAAAAISRSELFKAKGLPVSIERLGQYFSSPRTTIRREKLLQLLPLLLNHHWEVLDDGPWVRRCTAEGRTKHLRCQILFSREEDDFVVRCQCNGQPMPIVPPAGSPNGATRLQILPSGQLLLETTELPDSARLLRGHLYRLSKSPVVQMLKDGVRMRRSQDSAVLLRALWDALPGDCDTQVAPELRGLLYPPEERLQLTAELHSRDIGNGALMELHADWRLGTLPVSLQDINTIISRGNRIFKANDGQWLSLDSIEELSRTRDKLMASGIFDEEGHPAVLLRSEAKSCLKKIAHSGNAMVIPMDSQRTLRALMAEPEKKLPAIPADIDRMLRPYQRTGVNFLSDRAACNAGAILADDMGLGKTIQTLAMLSAWHQQALTDGQSFMAIVITPASVLSVWESQGRQFCPALPLSIYAGPPDKRRELLESFRQKGNGVLLTNYSILRQDIIQLSEFTFDFVILDEAQVIKNPHAQLTQAACALSSIHRVAITGTPIENRLMDFWSIMHFLNPGLLGESADFAGRYQSCDDATHLGARIRPLMLRRTKSAVALDLPPRTVTVLPVEMTDGQRAFYEETLLRSREESIAGGSFEILAAITRLRQVACDPQLLLKRPHDLGSGKLELLLEKCSELNGAGHSVIVFSQFTQMLDIISEAMDARKLPWLKITGDLPVNKRAEVVEQFNDGATPPVTLLLSLKAAGQGLTLTRADYVFIYDPWWNPAAENQAIDRAHRIGQTRPVFAYKLVAANTIEERIRTLMEAKQELFDALLSSTDTGESTSAPRLTADELRRLLDLNP